MIIGKEIEFISWREDSIKKEIKEWEDIVSLGNSKEIYEKGK